MSNSINLYHIFCILSDHGKTVFKMFIFFYIIIQLQLMIYCLYNSIPVIFNFNIYFCVEGFNPTNL